MVFEIGHKVTFTRGTGDKISTFIGLWKKVSERDGKFSIVNVYERNGLEYRASQEVLTSDLTKA